MILGPQASSIPYTRMIDITQPSRAVGTPLPYSFFSLFPPPEAECLWSQSLLPAACLSDSSADELVSLSVFHQVETFIRGCYLRPGNNGLCPRVAEGCLGDMDEVTPSVKSALDVSFIEAFAVGRSETRTCCPGYATCPPVLPNRLWSVCGIGADLGMMLAAYL